MSALVKVDFHGDTLFAQQKDDGTVVVAVKPIIERLGLDWSAQLQRIKRDEVLSGSVVIITMETPAGLRETSGLPLNLIPGFLFGISTGSISDPEVKATVVAYQRECHEVLYRHFMGERADPLAEMDWDLIGAKVQLVREARLTSGRKAAQALWAALGLPQGSTELPVSNGGALQGIDFVRNYLTDRTVEDAGTRVQASVLFHDFERWLEKQGGPRMTAKAFGMCLGALGQRKSLSQNVFYLGIRLKHISELMA